MNQTANEFLRAVRGDRSQVAFSRRLYYKGNPVADWENGRRYPTASRAFWACERVGVDVTAAIHRFHPPAAEAFAAGGDAGIAAWLEALRGSTPITEIAARIERSRYAVGRWMSGASRPRVPDFFRLVDACTGRLPDLVAELVDIEAVASLVPRYRSARASRRLALEEPWTEAILRILETGAMPAGQEAATLARILALDPRRVEQALGRMRQAGVIVERRGALVPGRPLTVDTRATEEERRAQRAHWTRAALARLEASPQQDDLFAYNVISVSRDDLAAIQALLRATYREIRSVVAASEPVETAALLQLQVIAWEPGG